MSGSNDRRGTGAMPPPDFAWQMGKTAASIRFVNEAERYLAEGRASADARQMLGEAIAAVKSGERKLMRFVTVESFLESGFPS